MGDGKREMGKGRWRWEMLQGAGAASLPQPLCALPEEPGAQPHPHVSSPQPQIYCGPRGLCLERSHGAAAARGGCSPIENTINENPGKASRGVIKEISSILHDIGIIQSLVKRSHVAVDQLVGITGARPAVDLGLWRVSTLLQNGV